MAIRISGRVDGNPARLLLDVANAVWSFGEEDHNDDEPEFVIESLAVEGTMDEPVITVSLRDPGLFLAKLLVGRSAPGVKKPKIAK
jgi:hypothetical protein